MVPTVRQRPGGINADPVVYLPHRSSPSATAAIMVRAAGEPTGLVPAIREELRRLDPNLPLYRVMSLQQAMDESGWNGRMAEVMAQSIAIIALLMALVGLYAVTAHVVHWWSPELGLRIALGAQPRGIAWIVLRQALTQLAVGLAVGVGCTYAFDRAFTVARSSRSGQADGHGRASFAHGVDRPRRHRRLRDSRAPGDTRRSGCGVAGGVIERTR